MKNNRPLNALRHHVTGAIERGESVAIAGIVAPVATHYQHLRHTGGNDTNGNPRRLYVLYDGMGDIVQVIREGYRGTPAEVRGLVQLPGYSVSAGDYRELIKGGK